LLFKNDLEIDYVSFLYQSAESPVLSEVSLAIHRGTSVGFIGTTGAGTSTLVDIILGLLAQTSGTVKVDGIDIQSNVRG
jgi:ABC-type multidrug transport system fused ATPase/permease subunit